MAGNIKKFYDLSAKLLSGEPFKFSTLKGKVVLIENVASLWGTTVRDYTQMNDLHSRYSAEGLVILGVPCNQFGHQENGNNDEILNCLKYVRPGKGFEPKITLLEKTDVNGQDAHPLFTFLRQRLPVPSDDRAPLMTDPKYIIWSPVSRTDVAWNFEKFLVGRDGEPFRRYSRKFLTKDLEADIKELLGRAE